MRVTSVVTATLVFLRAGFTYATSVEVRRPFQVARSQYRPHGPASRVPLFYCRALPLLFLRVVFRLASSIVFMRRLVLAVEAA